MRARLALIAAALGLGVLISAGPLGQTALAQNDKLLTIGNSAEPDTLDLINPREPGKVPLSVTC